MNSKEMALSPQSIVIPGGRNLEPSLTWLRGIGLDAPEFSERCLVRRSEGKLYRIASGSDIATSITTAEGDFGLLGSDKYGELPPGQRRRLAFAPVAELACRFALLTPRARDIDQLELSTIATSYPRALDAFVSQVGIKNLNTRVVSGKAEGYPAAGVTDGAFDIFETGSSAAANRLGVIALGDYINLGGVWRR